VSPQDKPLAWLHDGVKSPPFSKTARLDAGVLLRQLQRGELLSMPQSRPMPSVGARCHELRISDAGRNWRLVYRIDADAIVILEVFAKKTGATPEAIRILREVLLVIVGAEGGISTESGKLRNRWRSTGRLSVDVDAAQPLDQRQLARILLR
jgi:phage-related protein